MSAAPALAPAPRLEGRALVVHLGEPHAVLSWALAGGGRATASDVVVCEVRDDELRPPADAAAYLRARLLGLALPGAVGLLTSRAVDRYAVGEATLGDERARCVATVGLGNALRAGDPPGPTGRIGTINLVCQLSAPLSDLALVEALAVAVEARTAAVLEADVPSRRTGAPATGTGTDCVVVAAPARAGGATYAGKHTALGHLVGAATHEAVRRGVNEWLREHAP